ncbi:putative phage gp36 major capsid-like protein [Nitrobacteraceae bacterium AZCC 2161]|jgi:predicted phage gp36 major capsid-like protein
MDFDNSEGAREHKASLPAGDAQDVYDAMMRTFEDFKSENDDRLKAIEKRGGDVIAEEKVARIDAALNAHRRHGDAAGGFHRQHRRLAGGRGGADLRDAGRCGLRQR